MRLIAVFLCGVLFAVGLGISGMTSPAKVIAFLDIFGQWDPSLIFVMAGAVAVNLVLYKITLRRQRPLLEPAFIIPSQRPIDKRLIAGAAMFGIGWGLSGYCPGPALVSTITGGGAILAFVAAMIGGMLLYQWINGRRKVERPVDPTENACG